MALGATFPRFRTANQKPLFESAGVFVLYNLHNFYGKGLSVKGIVFLHPQGGYSSCFMIGEHAYMMRMRRFSCHGRPRRALQADRARTHLHAHVERATDPSPSPFSPEGNLIFILLIFHDFFF